MEGTRLKGHVCVGTRVECRLVSVARIKKGYYANEGREERRREFGRERKRERGTRFPSLVIGS